MKNFFITSGSGFTFLKAHALLVCEAVDYERGNMSKSFSIGMIV